MLKIKVVLSFIVIKKVQRNSLDFLIFLETDYTIPLSVIELEIARD